MADEKTDIEVQDTETPKAEEVETKSQLEDSTHQSESEDTGRKSTIARIADILKGNRKATVVEEKPEEVETETVDEEVSEDTVTDDQPKTESEEYEEIDPRFVVAAHSYGWDDARIIAYAESHDDHDLVMLTRMMEGKAQDVKEEDVVPKPEAEEPYSKVLQELETNEAVGDLTKQLLKSLVNDLKETKVQLQQLTTAQKETVETRQQQEWVGRLRTADERFDDMSKEFPELGTAKTLKRLPDGSLNPNDTAVQSRETLFKMAVALFESGSDWDKAVKDSLRWYRGGREDVVEAKVLNKIKANSKRVTPKREARKVTRKFANDQDEKAYIVNEALRKHGIELPA